MPYDNSQGRSDKQERRDQMHDFQRKLYSDIYRALAPKVMALVRSGDHKGAWDLLCDGPDKAGAHYRDMGGLRVRLGVHDRVAISAELHNQAVRAGFDNQARVDIGRAVGRTVAGMVTAARSGV